MPEGPEVRREADRVAAAVVGVPLVEVRFAFEHLQPFEAPLTASKVVAVETRGKSMLTRFGCGLTIYSHNQLYGRWIVGSADRPPQTRRSLRLAIVTQRRAARLYSASDIDVLPDDQLETYPRLAKLGPDILARTTTPELVASRLRSDRFARRRLGALLLDQSFLAGLGNYLRSDILNAARIHPGNTPGQLSEDEVERLAQLIVGLSHRSYETGGITNDLQRVEALKARGKTRRDYRHLAFRRQGQPCYACGGAIVKQESDGRSIFLCPSCQPGGP